MKNTTLDYSITRSIDQPLKPGKEMSHQHPNKTEDNLSNKNTDLSCIDNEDEPLTRAEMNEIDEKVHHTRMERTTNLSEENMTSEEIEDGNPERDMTQALEQILNLLDANKFVLGQKFHDNYDRLTLIHNNISNDQRQWRRREQIEWRRVGDKVAMEMPPPKIIPKMRKRRTNPTHSSDISKMMKH